MDQSPSRHNQSKQIPETCSAEKPKMSMLAMVTPSSYPSFNNDKHHWNPSTTSDYSKPRTEAKSIALPSIRQAFPELHLSVSPQNLPTKSTLTNHSPGAAASRPLASPEYIHSPESRKRRRISNEDEQEILRVKQVPRLYHSPEGPRPRQISPTRAGLPSAPTESWTGPARRGSFALGVTIPSPVEMKERADHRPTLPSLSPANGFEREAAPIHHIRERPATDFQPSLPAGGHAGSPPVGEARASYQEASPGYGYQHPGRYQSLSAGAIGPYERTPFAVGGAYGAHYQDTRRYGELGGIGGDNKQRKRRGNLPKETTDQLRSWFVGHLQHPYPTEDEKQELMRKTGLQMNQISNWFINARRRQLPAMISNARAESDVMNGQSKDGKILATTERGHYGLGKRDAQPLSEGEGEGGAYDDEMERRSGSLKRGSV